MSKPENNELSLGSVLNDFIAKYKLEKGLDKIVVRKTWARLMGNGVNSYTQAVRLDGSTLIVRLSSSVLREELSYEKERIIDMINQSLGKKLIKKIELY